MIYYTLNEDGTVSPVDLMTWAKEFEDIAHRRIGLDEINGIEVSTVFLGTDHNWLGGTPILFETMVFDREAIGDQFADLRCWRYHTRGAARAGHEAVVRALREQGPSALFDLDVPSA
jgi:hypothetical protein